MLSLMDQLGDRLSGDRIGILPLIPLAVRVARRWNQPDAPDAPDAPGAVPPQAAYPPPRRPLPAPPAPLIPSLKALHQANQQRQTEDNDMEQENDLGMDVVMGADGEEYAVDQYGRPRFRIRRRPHGGGGHRCYPPAMQGGGGEFGADNYGADDDGMLEDDLSDDDDIETGADELNGDMVDEETGEEFYGFDSSKAEGKIEKLKAKATQYQDRISKLQGRRFVPFKEKRIAKLMKKLGKVKAEIAEIKGKINAEKAKQAKQRRQAAALVAGAYAAGASRPQPAGNRPGEVPGTRGGQAAQRVIPARQGDAIRRDQAQQGQRFNVMSPPGSGRLLSVPMLASGSTTNRTSTTIVAPNVLSGTQVLTSEDVPYSQYKIVGFIANVRRTATGAATALQAESGLLVVTNLTVKGSPNLFLHDSFQDAEVYDTDHEHLQGLRAYPNVVSPNRASVTVAAIAGFADVILVGSFNLVVDQVADDTFGSGVPGPYAG